MTAPDDIDPDASRAAVYELMVDRKEDSMTTQDKLREVLTELRTERESLDRKIRAIESALAEEPTPRRRGRKSKAAGAAGAPEQS